MHSTVKEMATHSAAITANISNFVAKPEKAVANSANARMQMLKNSFASLQADDEKLSARIREIAEQLAADQAAFG